MESTVAESKAYRTEQRQKKRRVRDLRARVDELKTDLKLARAELEDALEDLVADDTLPLFDGANGQPEGDKDPYDDPAAPWRALGLDGLDVTARARGSLERHGIDTLGRLVDLVRDGGEEWFTGVKGLGGFNAQRVRQELDRVVSETAGKEEDADA